MMDKRREPWNPLLCSYPESEKVNSLSFEAETMFTRLLAKCDDNGNYWAGSKMLLCGLFARRFDAGQVTDSMCATWREELLAAGLICTYQHKGDHYLHLLYGVKRPNLRWRHDVRFPNVPPEVIPTDDEPPSTGRHFPWNWRSIRERILHRDNHTCVYCGRHAKTVDHIFPWSRGGSHDDTNLVACCKSCNSRKSDRTPGEANMYFIGAFRAVVVPHGGLLHEA